MAPTYIIVLESGGNVPTISIALELIEVFGCDIGDVMRLLAAARNDPPAGFHGLAGVSFYHGGIQAEFASTHIYHGGVHTNIASNHAMLD